MNNTIDNLIESMSIEELMLIVEDDNQPTTTINISDSVINIYNSKEKCFNTEPPNPSDDDYVCYNTLYNTGDFCENYCYDCEQRGAIYNNSLSLLDFPLITIPVIAPFYLIGKLFYNLAGSVKRPLLSFNQPKTPQIEDSEVIDTEIIEDREDTMSDDEIQQQLEYIKLAKKHDDINEYTRLFRMERGIA